MTTETTPAAEAIILPLDLPGMLDIGLAETAESALDMSLETDVPPSQWTAEQRERVEALARDPGFCQAVLRVAYGMKARDPEGVLQQTLMNAARPSGANIDPEKKRGWGAVAARNVVLSDIRASKSRPRETALELDESSYREDLRVDDNTEALLNRMLVQQLLGELPQGQREAITLYYLFDYSQKQVAEALGIPIGTVKSAVHGGMMRMRRMVAKESPTPGDQIQVTRDEQ